MDPNTIRKKAEQKIGRALTSSEAKLLNEAVVRYAKLKAVEAGDLSTEELAKSDPLAYSMAKKKGLTGKTSKADVDLQRTLRNNLKQELKDIGYQNVEGAYQKTQKVAENKSGDLSLIYSYVKVLDPNSVVREGEIALTSQAPSVAQQLARTYSRVAKGRLMTPEERSQIKEEITSLRDAVIEQAKPILEAYKEDADAYGLEADRVMGSYKEIDTKYDEVLKRSEAKLQEPVDQQQPSAVPSIDGQGNITINPQQIGKAAINALPTAGGIFGGILGSAAGPVGTVAGGAVGSGAGKTLETFIENPDPRGVAEGIIGMTPPGMLISKFGGKSQTAQDIQNETGIGALAGGAGELAGAGLRIAGKGLTQALPKKLFGGVFKEGMKATKAGVKSGTSLGDEALEAGVKGSADDIYLNSIKRVSELEDEIQGVLKNSKASLTVKEFQKYVNPLIGELKKAGSNSADDIISRIQRITVNNKGAISLKEANQIKRTLYDEARKAYGSQAGASIEGVKALAKGIKEKIVEKAPEVAKLNKDLGFYGRMADSMADKLSRSGRNNLLGLGDLLTGTITGNPAAPLISKFLSTTAAQTNIGQGLKTLGGIASKIPEQIGNTAQRVGSQILPRALMEKFTRQ